MRSRMTSGLLFPFQGEDVSLGIWLSAVGPSYVDVSMKPVQKVSPFVKVSLC